MRADSQELIRPAARVHRGGSELLAELLVEVQIEHEHGLADALAVTGIEPVTLHAHSFNGLINGSP